MDNLLQQYINDLKSSINQMAGLVEESLAIAIKAISEKDKENLDRVFDLESQINDYHKEIDHGCFRFLARQSPVAGDLRLIIVIIKMGVDLERMGDMTFSIALCLKNYFKTQPVTLANEVPKMSNLVRTMVSKGIEAFMQNNGDRAREVLAMEDQVNQYRDLLSDNLYTDMKQSSHHLESNLEIFSIVRSLERIGDHAANIAEEVIFLISGEDIRGKR